MTIATLTRRVARLRGLPGAMSLTMATEPVPKLGQDEVLVEIRANSLNYHDHMVLSGMIAVADGRIPLSDGAGTVIAAGPAVQTLVPGDPVIGTFFVDWEDGRPNPDSVGRITGDSFDGFAADYVVMPERCFTRMPAGLSFAEAATISCSGVTVWAAIAAAGGLTADSVVVVQGTGGVALWGLLLAKSFDAKAVALTSSQRKADALRLLGADLTVDYAANPSWADSVREFTNGRGADLIFEVTGGASVGQSIASCRMGGHIAALGFRDELGTVISVPELLLNHITIAGLAVGSHRAQRELVDHIERTGLKPHVGRTFPSEAIAEAFEAFLERDNIGKVVLENSSLHMPAASQRGRSAHQLGN